MSSAPWIRESELNITDTKARLHNEILALEKYLEPTSREILDRDELFLDVKYLVNGLWPGRINTVPFGPTETGLLLPASDVEVNLECTDKSHQVSKSDIYKAMLEKGVCDHIFYMEDTFTKVASKLLTIKKPTGILAKIYVDRDISDHNRVLQWKREYPELKPLYLTIHLVIHHCRPVKKQTYDPMGADSNKLPDYGLICLIVNYLRHEKPSNIPPEHNLAALLIGFFKFYGDLDINETAISLRDNGGGYLNPSDMPFDTPKNRDKLVILDPDKDRNVAKSCTCFAYLKNVMVEVVDILLERLAEEGNCNSILSSIIKIEPHDYNKSRKQGIEFKLKNLLVNVEVKMKKRKKSKKAAMLNSENGLFDSIKEEYDESSDDDELYTSAKYETIESIKEEYMEPRENGILESNQSASSSKLTGKRKLDDGTDNDDDDDDDDDVSGGSKDVNGKDQVTRCKYSTGENIDDVKGENINIKLEYDSNILEEQEGENSLNGGSNHLDDNNQTTAVKLTKSQKKKAKKKRRKEEEAKNASNLKIENEEGDQNNGNEAVSGNGNGNETQAKTKKRSKNRGRNKKKKAKKALLLI